MTNTDAILELRAARLYDRDLAAKLDSNLQRLEVPRGTLTDKRDDPAALLGLQPPTQPIWRASSADASNVLAIQLDE